MTEYSDERLAVKYHELAVLNQFRDAIHFGDSQSFIRLVNLMGNDKSIADAARVSYQNGTKKVSDDAALLRILFRHRHSSPFEMCEIKFHLHIPIYVMRQLVRHRTANINEESARYSVVKDEFEFVESDGWRTQSSSNKQGSEGLLVDTDLDMAANFTERSHKIVKEAYEFYEELIAAGVAREQARKILFVGNYTSLYWKMDARNLFHFLSLRMDSHAQLEIRQLADAIFEIVKVWLPISSQAFLDYQYGAKTFSSMELKVLEKMISRSIVLDAEFVKQFAPTMGKREINEFISFWNSRLELAKSETPTEMT